MVFIRIQTTVYSRLRSVHVGPPVQNTINLNFAVLINTTLRTYVNQASIQYKPRRFALMRTLSRLMIRPVLS